MQDISDPLLRYLSSRDPYLRKEVVSEYPDLQKDLNDPVTRTAILQWLRTEVAWDPSHLDLLINCLDFLRGGPVEEAVVVRPFLLHSNNLVRVSAFEFLLALYYPDKNPDALLLVFQNMLSDKSDKVRSVAAHYLENVNVAGELKEFLDRWYKNAEGLGFKDTESFERIGRILGK